jgi:hypothetical protein
VVAKFSTRFWPDDATLFGSELNWRGGSRNFRISSANAVSFSSVRDRHEIKVTANLCIALRGSTNAVNISSARTMNRFP